MIEQDTTSTEYHLKRIVTRASSLEDVKDAEDALEALKQFAIDLAGLMSGLEERLDDLDDEIYRLEVGEGQ